MGRLLRHARASTGPLAHNQAHRVAAEMALVHYDSGAVYSFIPKNACSTMRLSLAKANGCIRGPEDWQWIHDNNPTFRASLRELVTAPYTFVILRCPYARLASVFLDKLVSRNAEYWTLQRRNVMPEDPDSFTFRDFVKALGKDGLLNSNIHWRPQVDLLVYEDYDDWFRLEDFAAAASKIEERTGLQIEDARGLTKHATSGGKVGSELHADTPLSELARLKAAGELPAQNSLYDDALREAVAEIYAADIALFETHFGPQSLTFPHTTE